MTRVTTHSGQPSSLAPARVTRSSPPFITLHSLPRSQQPSHSQRPAVTRCSPPPRAAGSHCSHSQRPAVTSSSPPQSTRPSHSQWPVSLRWRSGQPLLATASLTDSVTRYCSGAQSQSLCGRSDLEHPDSHILNTLIAILCLFIYEFIYEFILSVFIYMNSYMSSYMNS